MCVPVCLHMYMHPRCASACSCVVFPDVNDLLELDDLQFFMAANWTDLTKNLFFLWLDNIVWILETQIVHFCYVWCIIRLCVIIADFFLNLLYDVTVDRLDCWWRTAFSGCQWSTTFSSLLMETYQNPVLTKNWCRTTEILHSFWGHICSKRMPIRRMTKNVCTLFSCIL